MYIYSGYHYSTITNNEVGIYLLTRKDVFNILNAEGKL